MDTRLNTVGWIHQFRLVVHCSCKNGHLQRRSPMLLRICLAIHLLPIQPPNDLPVQPLIQPSICPPIQPPICSPLGQTLPPYLLSEGESRIVSQMWRMRGALCPARLRGKGTVLPLFKEGLWHLEQMMLGWNCCHHIFMKTWSAQLYLLQSCM